MRRLLCLFRGHQWHIEENTRLRARSRTVFGAEPTGRRFLVTRDSDQGSRPTRGGPR